MKDSILVTHANCMDGSTCAVLFLNVGGKQENIFYSSPSHHKIDELVKSLFYSREEDIYIADASISLELAEQLDKVNNGRLKLFDHHASAIPLAKFDWCEIDVENTRCGSKVFFDYLKGPRVEIYRDLVDVVDDVDRWQWNLDNSKYVSTFHQVVGQQLFVERFARDPSVILTANENYVVKIENKKKQLYIENKKKEVIKSLMEIQHCCVNVGFVEAGNYQSELGHAIVEDPTLDIDVAIMIGSRGLSFRKFKDCPVDLGVLAKQFGGGGHQGSSGSPLSKLLNKELVEFVVECFQESIL